MQHKDCEIFFISFFFFFLKIVFKSNFNNESCLHLSMYNKNTEIIKYFLSNETNSDIYQKGTDNSSTLHYAASGCEDVEIMKFLVEEKKMKLNHLNNYGETVLHAAAQANDNLDVIKYLLEKKCNHLATTEHGETCFQMVCYNNKYQVIKYFVENNLCDVNQTNLYGEISLHFLCKKNVFIENLIFLLENGANPNHQCNDYSESPFHCLFDQLKNKTVVEIKRFLIVAFSFKYNFSLLNRDSQTIGDILIKKGDNFKIAYENFIQGKHFHLTEDYFFFSSNFKSVVRTLLCFFKAKFNSMVVKIPKVLIHMIIIKAFLT